MQRSRIVLFACLMLVPLLTFAQGEPGLHKHSVGANLELNVPVGNFADAAGIGYGFNGRYQFGVDARGVLTASAGYLVWGTKDLGQNTTVQPKAFNFFLGGRYYFAGAFYGSLEGGLYFVTHTYSGNLVGFTLGNKTLFMLPIGVGFQKNGFEIGARYMLLDTDFNCLSFTLGYNFSL